MNNLTRPLFSWARRQCGVSLIEVLVAVVVLAIGLLGLAGLQLSALRNTQNAAERSNVIMHVYSIAEVMRADRGATERGDFALGVGDGSPTGTSFAAVQLAAWRDRITDSLGPTASGGVSCSNTAIAGTTFVAITCTVTIRWDDSMGLKGEAAEVLITEVEL